MFCFNDLSLVGVRSLNVKKQTEKKIILDAEERTYFCFFLALLTKCREVHAGQQNLQLMNKKHRFYWIEWSTNERVNMLPYFWSPIHNLWYSSFQYCHPISLQSFLIGRFSHAELRVIKWGSVFQACIWLNRTWLVYLKNKINVRKGKWIACWKI